MKRLHLFDSYEKAKFYFEKMADSYGQYYQDNQIILNFKNMTITINTPSGKSVVDKIVYISDGQEKYKIQGLRVDSVTFDEGSKFTASTMNLAVLNCVGRDAYMRSGWTTPSVIEKRIVSD